MNMFFRITLDYNDLADEIVADIPETHFVSETDTFLDPAFAGGQLLKAVAKRLNNYGHSIENIRSRLFGYEDSIAYLNHPENYSTAMIADLSIVQFSSLLKGDIMKKFSVVLGNDPYQGVNEVAEDRVQPKNHSLWSDFLEWSFEVVEEGGTVVKVSPDSWMSPTHAGFKTFKKKQLVYANLDCSEHFPGVGSSFTWWIAKNSPVTENTKLNTIDFNFNDFDYIPRNPEQSLSIHKKVMMSDLPKLSIKTDTTCHSSKSHVRKEQTSEFCFPLLHTNAQTRYSNVKSKFHDNLKVFWTYSGYFIPRKNYGDIGHTECAGCVIANNEYEVECYYSMMNSKLYKFIIETGKWSGFINGKVVNQLPKLEMKVWTDEELYARFNLTQEEIEYIEANVK